MLIVTINDIVSFVIIGIFIIAIIIAILKEWLSDKIEKFKKRKRSDNKC